jgi:hypothetical protein
MPLDCGASDAVVGAVVLTVTTEVPEPFATELGLSEHVGGRATTGVMPQDRFTVLLKPFIAAIVIVDVADPPAETVVGESAAAAIVKLAAAFTVRLTDVLWVNDPEDPVTVTLEVPAGVVAEVAIVRVEVTGAEPGVTDGGAKEQLAPDGRPAGQVNATALLNPFTPLTEMVYDAEVPGVTEAVLGGDTLTAKSGATPACRNATACMTQAAFAFCVAVASITPAGGPIRCSTLSP